MYVTIYLRVRLSVFPPTSYKQKLYIFKVYNTHSLPHIIIVVIFLWGEHRIYCLSAFQSTTQYYVLESPCGSWGAWCALISQAILMGTIGSTNLNHNSPTKLFLLFINSLLTKFNVGLTDFSIMDLFKLIE